jgi:hypothetical protein
LNEGNFTVLVVVVVGRGLDEFVEWMAVAD